MAQACIVFCNGLWFYTLIGEGTLVGSSKDNAFTASFNQK